MLIAQTIADQVTATSVRSRPSDSLTSPVMMHMSDTRSIRKDGYACESDVSTIETMSPPYDGRRWSRAGDSPSLWQQTLRLISIFTLGMRSAATMLFALSRACGRQGYNIFSKCCAFSILCTKHHSCLRLLPPRSNFQTALLRPSIF